MATEPRLSHYNVVGALDGVYAKLDRARAHTRELHGLIAALTDTGSFRIVAKRDDRPNTLSFYVESMPVIGPQVGAVFGDFLVNCRAALDHLAWLVAPESAKSDPKVAKSVQFPIEDSDRSGQRSPALIETVTNQRVLDAIEAVQPYNVDSSREVTSHPLRLLRDLCNTDKHRVLLTSAFAVRPTGIWWGTAQDDPSPIKVTVGSAPVRNDEPIARFDFGDREPPQDFDPHLSLEIRLVEGDAHAQRLPLVDFAHVIYNEVEHFTIGMQLAPLFGLGPRHHISPISM